MKTKDIVSYVSYQSTSPTTKNYGDFQNNASVIKGALQEN